MAEETPDTPSFDWEDLGQRVRAEIRNRFLPRCSSEESSLVATHLMPLVKFTPKTVWASTNKLFTTRVSEKCEKMQMLQTSVICFVFGMSKASKSKKIDDYIKNNPNSLDKFQIGNDPCVPLPMPEMPKRTGVKRTSAEAQTSGGAGESNKKRVKSKAGLTGPKSDNCAAGLDNPMTNAEDRDAALDKSDAEAKDRNADPDSHSTNLGRRKSALKIRETNLKDNETGLDSREARLKDREAGLAERETKLEERESAIESRETELNGREATLKDRESVLNSLEAELLDREVVLEECEIKLEDRNTDLEDRATALDNGETEMDDCEASFGARKAALDNSETELKDREADLHLRKAVLDSGEADLEKREAGLQERETNFKQRENNLENRENEVDNREPTPQDKASHVERECKQEHADGRASTQAQADRLFNQTGSVDYQKSHSDAVLNANAARVLFDMAVGNVQDTACRDELVEQYKVVVDNLFNAINLCFRISLQMDRK